MNSTYLSSKFSRELPDHPYPQNQRSGIFHRASLLCRCQQVAILYIHNQINVGIMYVLCMLYVY